MMWRHILQNIAAMIGMIVLIAMGYPWWSLLLMIFVIWPSGSKCDCEKGHED